MDIMYLIAAAAQQQAILTSTPGGPESYYSYDTGTENDDWEIGLQNSGSVSFQSNRIDLYVDRQFGTAEVSAVTADTIDMSDFSTITVNFLNSDSNAVLYLILGSSKTDTYTTYDYRQQQSSPSASPQDVVLDVSGVSGSYYIRLHNVKTSKGSTTCNVYTVYIET